jgi:predicted MFS family arabinose efflux permease
MSLVSRLEGIREAYARVARNRSLRRVALAFVVFNAQEYAIWLAFTIYAYGRGGPGEAGAVAIAQLIPAALVAPFAAVLGDRMRRDRALALGYGAQSLAVAACAVALWIAPAPVAYGFAVIWSCAVTLTRPVHYAILPALASTPGELTAANSVSSSAEALGIFLGPLANSLLIVIEGPGTVCAAFAVLTSIAALSTRRLDLHGASTAGGVEGFGDVLRSARRGFMAIVRDLPAGALLLFGGIQFLILGILDVFFVVLAIDVLSMGEGGTGVLNAAVGIGGLVGAGLTAILIGRTRLSLPIELAVGCMALMVAALAWAGGLGTTIGVLAVAGGARSFLDVGTRVLLQRSVPEDTLSRVFGLQESLMMVGLAIGAGLAPLMIALFGAAGAFAAVGALLLLAGLAVWPFLGVLDRRSAAPDPQLVALLSRDPIFRPLDQSELERVSRHLEPVLTPAGTDVFLQGDQGDRFFLIVEGTAAVTIGGDLVRELGPGDHFGEIALLRHVPRTATVSALEDLRLLALDRHPFLDAVMWSRSSIEWLNAHIDERLSELPGS